LDSSFYSQIVWVSAFGDYLVIEIGLRLFVGALVTEVLLAIGNFIPLLLKSKSNSVVWIVFVFTLDHLEPTFGDFPNQT